MKAWLNAVEVFARAMCWAGLFVFAGSLAVINASNGEVIKCLLCSLCGGWGLLATLILALEIQAKTKSE